MSEPNFRTTWVQLLLESMRKDERVWLVTGDLGYKVLDPVRAEFPERFLNCGAAEQAMMGIGVGLASSGKRPMLYSISPFVLYRGFETVRNYLHYEGLPVTLVGSGRGKNYETEGFSHWIEEDRDILKVLDGVNGYWPDSIDELKSNWATILKKDGPAYLNLPRSG
jgi:transketolase